MSSVGIGRIFDSLKTVDAPANILGVGTANPPNIFPQNSYPDFYFGVTNKDHMVALKQKFKRILIKKRHMSVTEEFLRDHPNMCTRGAPSFNVRQEFVREELPKLGSEAASKAIEDWGQPVSSITHLLFCTSTSIQLPGFDCDVAKLLELNPSVNRLMMSPVGCHGGATALRVAKNIAESNKGARVLAVCADIPSGILIYGPNEARIDQLVGAAIFGDGAAAVVVGSDPVPETEKSIFEIISANQTTLPNSKSMISLYFKEDGASVGLGQELPDIIGEHIARVVDGVTDNNVIPRNCLNSMFWAVHPGGTAILDRIEMSLGLEPEKLSASRQVLSEYGNMSAATVLFVLDEMRRESINRGLGTTGEGAGLGLLLGIGPGVTVETLLLNSVSI